MSFDELSYNTNNYYYSIDHYDFQWNKTNIFKNEFISGYDEIRISNYNKSLNTLQKYTNYTFSFPNEQFKIKVSGNYILSLKDTSDNIIFQRKFIVIENVNAGNIEIYRPKDLKIRDLTGAGDLFAAGYLHGFINNLSSEKCLEEGTRLSSRVIQQIGARF